MALAILGLLLTALFPLLWFARSTATHQQEKAEVQYTICQARYFLVNDLRHSCNVFIKNSRYGAVEEEGSWLLLEMEGELVDYYVWDGQLYRDSSNAPPLPVVENLEDFYCRHSAPGLITVRFGAVSGQARMESTASCSYGFY